MFISGCAKDRIEATVNKERIPKSSLRKEKGDSVDISSRLDLMLSPLRDILVYNPSFLNSNLVESYDPMAATTPGGPDFHCCNGICLTIPTNPDPGTHYVSSDAWGNFINFRAQYGTDYRQVYYVYIPPNVSPSPSIVLLIHGGGWYSGPTGIIPGFPFNWGDDANESMVKDLLNNGYVVVSMLYRLVQYGENSTEFGQNTIGWDEQIDDVASVVNHIRANFSTCLYGYTIPADKIHILGESAGGHLALMYAYKRANPTYIKSVVSMYAPTNINSFGDKLDDNTIPFACNTNFQLNNLPYWLPMPNIYDLTIEYQSVSPFNCPTLNYGADSRAIFSYNLIQSAMRQPVSNPGTNTILYPFSPKQVLGPIIIPTFIMHGNGAYDHIVPYTQSTTGMNTSLSNNGGLINNTPYIFINQFFPGNIPASSTYSTNPKKHIVKLYNGTDHGWTGPNLDPNLVPAGLRDNVRSEVIKWFNGH